MTAPLLPLLLAEGIMGDLANFCDPPPPPPPSLSAFFSSNGHKRRIFAKDKKRRRVGRGKKSADLKRKQGKLAVQTSFTAERLPLVFLN